MRLENLNNFKPAMIISLCLLGVLWLVHGYAYFFDDRLWLNGIRPRDTAGLLGIIFAPLLHGSWAHLAANSPPLVVMTAMLFYGYPKSATKSLIGIWIVSGLLTWLFARGNIHIGFSGINHGLMFFLFTIGVLRRDHRSIALAMIVFFLYGGMIWSVFPNDPAVSFELHLFGSIAGVLMAFIFRSTDKKLIPKKYYWEQPGYEESEQSSELQTDDEIGDSWKLESPQGLDLEQQINKKNKSNKISNN